MEPLRNEYIEALTRWLIANRDFNYLDHGPEPDPKDYNFKTELEQWHAKKLREQIIREVKRKV